MGFPKHEVWHFTKTDSKLIESVHAISTNESLKERSSDFSFKLRNINGSFNSTFSVGDQIKIRAGYGTVINDLLVGKITEAHQEDYQTNILTVKGKTNHDVLLTRRPVVTYKNNSHPDFSVLLDEQGVALSNDGTGLGSSIVTSSRIIRDLLRQFALGPSGTELFDQNLIHFPNYDAAVGYGIKPTDKPIVDSAGADRTVVFNYETLMDAIIRLSSKEYAGKEHTFWIDDNWNMTWLPTDELTDFTTNLIDEENIIDCDFQYGTKNITNYFIIDCGRDLTDSQDIIIIVYDIQSIAKNGQKEEFIKDTQDRNALAVNFTGTNDEFINAVSEATRLRYTADILSKSQIKWKGTVTLKGSSEYRIGNRINITHKNYNFVGKSFIVKGIKNSIDNKGWRTKLEVEATEYGK